MVKTDSLPAALKENALFCLWKLEKRKDRNTKVPYNPKTGKMAKSNDPNTFGSFVETIAKADNYSGIGVGIFNGLCAIDIDHCINADGSYSNMASDIIAMLDSYTEISPSGTGIRILFYAPKLWYDKKQYYINYRDIGLEVYVAGVTNKFVTVTGNTIRAVDIAERKNELTSVLNKYMRKQDTAKPTTRPASTPKSKLLADDVVIFKAGRAKDGQRFTSLFSGDDSIYNSASEADLALCNKLAFWCRKDIDQMDRLFRRSGLMRPKWDEVHGSATYGEMTINEAIDRCTCVYQPKEGSSRTSQKFETDEMLAKLITFHPESNSRFEWADTGNGYLFADCVKSIARYVPERKSWFIYDGTRWQPDTSNLQTMELCKKWGAALLKYAKNLKDEKIRTPYTNYAQSWQRRGCRETILKDAAGVYPVHYSEFDSDIMILNCLNGTLDLRTGELRPHKPEDMLTKIAGVSFDPDAKAERWTRFIDEIMMGDIDKAAYFQKSLGYALTGDTRHECFFILYGATSRNGKGTAMETFAKLMGEYARAARPETISQKNKSNGSAPSEDIARLVGARFVNISEPDKGMPLSSALIKSLTGNDTITSRYLNENSFEYKPQYKIFMNTNYLPTVADATIFRSGRVKVIPFARHFSEQEQDKQLKIELARPYNLSGILNWCIEGLRKIDREGFAIPQSVIAATEKYQHDSDRIARFIEDEMEEGSQYEALTTETYVRYKEWCELNGHVGVESLANFRSAMESYTPVKKKRSVAASTHSNPVSCVLGYRLRPRTENAIA